MHQAGTGNVTLAVVIWEGVVFGILSVFIALKLQTSVKIILEMKFYNLIFHSFQIGKFTLSLVIKMTLIFYSRNRDAFRGTSFSTTSMDACIW